MGGEPGLLWQLYLLLAPPPGRSHVLVLRYHHSIGDGGSVMQLTEQLFALVAGALAAARQPPRRADVTLPPPPTVEELVANLDPPSGDPPPAVHVPEGAQRADFGVERSGARNAVPLR